MQLLVSRIHLENFSDVYSCVPGLSLCHELWALLADRLLLSHWLPGHWLCSTSAESLCQGGSFRVLLAQWLSYLTLQSVPRINCMWQATGPSPLSSFKQVDLSLMVKHSPAVLHIEMLEQYSSGPLFSFASVSLSVPDGKLCLCLQFACEEAAQNPASVSRRAVGCARGAGGHPAVPPAWAHWAGAAADLCSGFDWPNTSQQSSPLVAAIV